MNNYLSDTGDLFIPVYGWITIFLWIVTKARKLNFFFCKPAAEDLH